MPSRHASVSLNLKSTIMRALLFLLPVVLVSCGPLASQREILKRAQAEINQREPWGATAAVFVTNPGENYRVNWKVKAGAVDYSAYHPAYKGTYFVSGTERELRFTRDGCLIGYEYAGSRCPMPDSTLSSGGAGGCREMTVALAERGNSGLRGRGVAGRLTVVPDTSARVLLLNDE